MKLMTEFLRCERGRRNGFFVVGIFALCLALVTGRTWAVDYDPVFLGKWTSVADAWKVVVRSNLAYVANDLGGLQVISVSNPVSPVRVGGYDTAGTALGLVLGSGPTSNFVYVADGTEGVEVINISNPTNLQFVGTIGSDFIQSANAVTITPFFGGGQYLYIADDTFGLDIFRIVNGAVVNNLDSANLTANLLLDGTATGLQYRPTDASSLFVADGDGGLAKVDTSVKTDPVLLGNADFPLDGYARDVVIDGSFDVYVACGDPSFGISGVQAVAAATGNIKATYVTSGDAYGLAFTNKLLFVAAAQAGVVVLDMTTPTKPKRLGGYFTGDEAYGAAVAGTNLYVAAGGLQILNPYFPANPQRLGQYADTNVGNVIATTVAGNLAFVGDETIGLQVVNVSNAASPKLLTTFGTAAAPNNLVIGSNYAFLAEGASGLEIVDISNLTNLVTVGIWDTPGFANDVVVSGDYAYVADGLSGLIVVNVSDPSAPEGVGTNNTVGTANGLAISNNLLYVADGGGGLAIINITDPAHPTETGNVLTGGIANGVALSGHYAFVADGDLGLSVIDVANPANPVRVGGLAVRDTANAIALNGNYAYLASGLSSLDVVDISNPLNPRRVGGNTAFDALSVSIYSNRVYVATGAEGVAILPLVTPVQPIQFAGNISIITNTLHLWLTGPTNQPLRVQRSTNLTSWADWQSLTLTNNNPLELVDTNFPASSRRFYRAVSP